MKFNMEFAIRTAVLIFLLGTMASAKAQQEEHKQEGKPEQQQGRPAQQQRQAQPAARQQTRDAQPAQQQRQAQPEARQQTRSAQPAQQQQAQPEARQQTRSAQPAQQQQAQPEARQQTRSAQPAQQQRVQQGDAGRNRPQAPQTRAAAGNRGNSEHGRISDEHYAASFGREHSFHVNRGDYDSRRFAYGGYSFAFIDPWPIGWGYSDDVYVVYADDGYYMYDRVHPGLRISINIL
jgi:hypothetical protein